MDKLYIIKIGGNVIDDEEKLSSFLKDFASIPDKKILIHGGGTLATKLAQKLGVTQTVIDGRRITDEQTLKIVVMIYAGHINKNIVAQLQAKNCHAVGLCGADGNTIVAHKRVVAKLDYGFAGDIDSVDVAYLQNLLQQNFTPVIAPITHDKKGQLLNTNADTIAQEIAKAFGKLFEVSLIYSFEKNGVLADSSDDASILKKITPNTYNDLKTRNVIWGGMIPKLDNAFLAIKSGVKKVVIGKADNLLQLVSGEGGTTITDES